MKKLKTWQIVLLVIFYPVGICVFVYRVWKKGKLKKDREAEALARQEAKEREEAERAAAEERRRLEVREEMRLYEDITFKIVGVTYKNADIYLFGERVVAVELAGGVRYGEVGLYQLADGNDLFKIIGRESALRRSRHGRKPRPFSSKLCHKMTSL